MPTQMPRNGTPRAMAAANCAGQAGCIEAFRCREVTDAGKHDALRRLDQRQIAVGHDVSAPRCLSVLSTEVRLPAL